MKNSIKSFGTQLVKFIKDLPAGAGHALRS